MKIQDILFVVFLLSFLFTRNPRILLIAGIVCLLFSIPLFSLWVFFTAERLMWYAAAFFLAAILFHFRNIIIKK